jgi:hypothetical protein
VSRSSLLFENQPCDNLARHLLGLFLYLLNCLVLYRVFDIDRIKVGAAKGAGLSPRCSHELRSRDGDGGDAEIFEFGGIVQTARCAGASIGKRFNHRMTLGQLLNHRLGRGFGKRGFGFANHSADLKTLFQKAFQVV